MSQVSQVEKAGQWLEVGFGMESSSFTSPGLQVDCGLSSGASAPAAGCNHSLRRGQAAPAGE